MSDARYGPDTIFYTMKLKRTKTPAEVFEKMKKCVKKKGATKDWRCTVDEDNNVFTVDLGDGMSESFCVSFDENKICRGFCKVYFPTSGELFDDENKSGFKALINMLLSVRTMLSQLEISDDHGIAADYAESRKYKLRLRELTDAEQKFAREVFDSLPEYNRNTDHPDFIAGVVYRSLGIPMNESFDKYINRNIMSGQSGVVPCLKTNPMFETYLYETSEHKGIRLSECPRLEYTTGAAGSDVCSFILAASELYCFRDHYREWSTIASFGKYAAIHKFYRDKVYPMLDTMPDAFERCLTAYRFFLSAYEYCGFVFVGKK